MKMNSGEIYKSIIVPSNDGTINDEYKYRFWKILFEFIKLMKYCTQDVMPLRD